MTGCSHDWVPSEYVLKGQIRLLAKDFEFIQEEKKDEEIVKVGKKEYFRHIKSKVENAAFLLYTNHIRNNRKKKKKYIVYESF